MTLNYRSSVVIAQILGVLLLTACTTTSPEQIETETGDGSERDNDDVGDVGPAAEGDLGQLERKGAEGPSADLLGYVYPLDGTELETGWSAFEAPIVRTFWRGVGVCLRDEGYREVGDALMVMEPDAPSEPFRFPRLRRLRNQGFEHEPAEDVMYLLDWISIAGEDVDDALFEHLAKSPEFQILPTADAVIAFWTVYIECQQESYALAAFSSAMELRHDWHWIVDDVHEHPALAPARASFASCIQGSFLNLADQPVGSLEEAWGVVNDFILASDGVSAIEELNTHPAVSGEGLLVAGIGYADCVEPFIEARRPILAAEREALVQENFGALLAMEQLFVALLDG